MKSFKNQNNNKKSAKEKEADMASRYSLGFIFCNTKTVKLQNKLKSLYWGSLFSHRSCKMVTHEKYGAKSSQTSKSSRTVDPN